MATVYKVQNDKGQFFALKVLHSHLNSERKLVERFKQEFSIGKKMASHANFVDMFALEKHEGNWCILMEYVEGKTFEKVLLDPPQAIAVIASLCMSLYSFHKRGFVHRDLKPENIILSPKGQIKIMDYGISRELSNAMTRTGTTMGTVLYMAPEQLKAEKNIDHRADIYSLAVILYRLLSKRDPQGLSNKAEYPIVMEARLSKAIRKIPGDVDPGIHSFICQLMAIEAKDRPSDCKQVLSSLQQLKDSPKNIDKILKNLLSTMGDTKKQAAPKQVVKKRAASPARVNKTTKRQEASDGKSLSFLVTIFIVIILLCVGIYFLGPPQLRQEIQKILS